MCSSHHSLQLTRVLGKDCSGSFSCIRIVCIFTQSQLWSFVEVKVEASVAHNFHNLHSEPWFLTVATT